MGPGGEGSLRVSVGLSAVDVSHIDRVTAIAGELFSSPSSGGCSEEWRVSSRAIERLRSSTSA